MPVFRAKSIKCENGIDSKMGLKSATCIYDTGGESRSRGSVFDDPEAVVSCAAAGRQASLDPGRWGAGAAVACSR